MPTKKNSAKNKATENTTKPSAKEDSVAENVSEPSGTVLQNTTNQKQSLELNGEQIVFNAYEKKHINLDEEKAKSKFNFWILKGILNIIK